MLETNKINIIYISYDEFHDIKSSILSIEVSEFIQIHIFETGDYDLTRSSSSELIKLGYDIKVYSTIKEGFIELHWCNIIKEYNFYNVLLLCADEQLPLLRKDQIKILANECVEFPRRNLIGDYEIRGGGWGVNQDYQIRYFKNPRLNDSLPQPHILPFKFEKIIRLSNLVIKHRSYKNLYQFIERFNRYTSLCEQFSSSSYSSSYMIYRSIKHFLRRYIIQFGFKDGALGFVLCVMMGLYFTIGNLKSKEK